jgi:3-oxoacyl-[acyl-carrier protein] reductase
MTRRVLVTGAGRGIGAAVAHAFAALGARVAVADIAAPACAADLSFATDVSDEAAVTALANGITAAWGGLDVLVHCAGIIHEAPLLQTPVADFDRIIAVNLRGSFLLGQAAIRLMTPDADDPPRVLMIASDMAHYGRETFSPYVASKHGVLGLARSWAHEFAPGILVNAICPGPIDTDMLSAAQMSAEWREKEVAIPLARFGQPQEVAALALFLAGEGGRFFTGQAIGPNGGSVMP